MSNEILCGKKALNQRTLFPSSRIPVKLTRVKYSAKQNQNTQEHKNTVGRRLSTNGMV